MLAARTLATVTGATLILPTLIPARIASSKRTRKRTAHVSQCGAAAVPLVRWLQRALWWFSGS